MRLFLLAAPTVDDFWAAVLDPIFADAGIEVVGACVEIPREEPLQQKLRRELRKGRGGYVLVMAARTLARPLGTPETPAAAFLRSRGVLLREVDDLYAEDTLDYIRGTKPDCLFRFGFGLIKEPVLSLAPKGVVSYHHGDLRRYRGQPVAFWELLNGESEMGVTVQILDARLDAGRIVVEKRVPIRPTDSWRTLERRAFAASVEMAYEACTLLSREGFEPTAVGEEELGRLHTTPNLRQWTTLQAKVLARRVRAALRRT